MDTTTKLKDELILKIKNTQDIDLLKSIKSLLVLKEDDFYDLTKKQEESIAESQAQYENEEAIDNKKAISDLRKWLKNQ